MSEQEFIAVIEDEIYNAIRYERYPQAVDPIGDAVRAILDAAKDWAQR